MMQIDFGRTAADYSRHRAGFPDRFFDRLFADGHAASGQRALDLGAGTGTVARGLATRGCAVTGVDPSTAMMRQAKRLDVETGVSVDYVFGTAEATGQPDHCFDVVTAGQCWHWFDRPRAADEAIRILKPGGRIVIAHFDWLPLPGNVVQATEQLILSFNPNWRLAGGTGIYSAWFADLSIAGFADLESFSFDEVTLYTHEAWRGRIRASAGVGASLPSDEVDRFDQAHAALLRDRFPADPLGIPHRIFALSARAPA